VLCVFAPLREKLGVNASLDLLTHSWYYPIMRDNEELEIQEDRSPGAVKFILKGRVNAASANFLQHRLETAINEGHTNIVVNMFRIEYLSSVGIRVILKIYKQTSEKGGTFKIEHPSENVKNVLGMVALKDMMVE
jgi:anti-anti-sigma factor